MSHQAHRLPLREDAAKLVPDSAGVFVLWNKNRAVFIGMATPNMTLRQLHLAAVEAALPAQRPALATEFSFEVTADVPSRYLELHLSLAVARPGDGQKAGLGGRLDGRT
jgi:hypothetical protein